MAVTKTFKEAVKSNSVLDVRIMMKDSLITEPTFTLFGEMEKIASVMEGLYDEYDGKSFQLDKSTWDDNYMNKLMVQVVGNFSHERLDHLKEVVRYLRPVEEKTAEAPKASVNNVGGSKRAKENTHTKERDLSYQEQKKRDREEGRIIKVVGGAAAGAVAGGILAGVLEAPVVAGVLAGAAIAGAATYIYTGKE